MNYNLKKIATIVTFLVLFPYTVTLCTYGIGGMGGSQAASELNSRYEIAVSTSIGVEVINMEEYMVGLIAGCISGTYELEAIKAQTVILRTNIMAFTYDVAVEEYLPYEIISAETIPYPYLEREEREELWGEDFDTIESKIREAVKDTKNMVITYEEKAIEAPFFAVSAGKTRNGIDVFGENEYPYLVSATCEYDVSAADYLATYELTFENIMERMGIKDAEKENMVIQIEEKDSAGYALQLNVGGVFISGELFRERLELPSSYLIIEQNGNEVILHTKGIGHGFGMSQYAANELAKEGIAFMDILHFFYKNVKIQVYA